MSFDVPLTGGVISSALAVYGCIGANVAIYLMVERINRKSEPEAWENALFWYPGKWGRLVRRYREADPEGTLHRQATFHTVLMFVGAMGAIGAGTL